MTWRLALRDLWSSKLRLFLTGLSVVLGVAFVAGTFVLTDTINRAFDTVFSDANANTAVVVQSEEEIGQTREPLPAALLGRVQAVPGVQAAQGGVFGLAGIIGSDGKAVTTGGAPTLAGAWGTVAELNPFTLREGGPPTAPDDVVIDVSTAREEGFRVGDRTAPPPCSSRCPPPSACSAWRAASPTSASWPSPG